VVREHKIRATRDGHQSLPVDLSVDKKPCRVQVWCDGGVPNNVASLVLVNQGNYQNWSSPKHTASQSTGSSNPVDAG